MEARYSVWCGEYHGQRGPAWGYNVLDTPLDVMARHLTRSIWSPIIFEQGYRNSANFRETQICALDFENPEYPLAQALNDFCDMRHIIGTSRNHQREKDGHPPMDRFRVVMFFEKPFTDLEHYTQNMLAIIKRYGADPQCADGARLYYPCREIVSFLDDGYLVDVVEKSTHKEERLRHFNAKEKYLYLHAGVLPEFAEMFSRTVIPVGSRNSACWRVARDLFKVGFATDDVYDWIVASPTYRDTKVPFKLAREILQVISSAEKSWRRENEKALTREKQRR